VQALIRAVIERDVHQGVAVALTMA
jgi:hypothetical protein